MKTLEAIKQLKLGGDKNVVLWKLLGGRPGRVTGIEAAFVGIRDEPCIVCVDTATAEEVMPRLRSATDELTFVSRQRPDGCVVIWGRRN